LFCRAGGSVPAVQVAENYFCDYMNQQPREKISAFIVCYNEEDHIEACIRSVDFCDEVIVIDSFSQDKTVELARNLGAVIYQRKWSGYIDQKAFGLSKTTNEWIIHLDTDERVSEELKKSVLQVLEAEHQPKSENEDTINGYYINRVVFHLGKWWRHGGWYPEWRLRFFRKSKTTWGGTEPHDKPIVQGKTAKLSGEILHYSYDNIDEQFERITKYSTISAKEEFNKGAHSSVFSIVVKPIVRFIRFYFIKKGYKEGVPGLIVAIAESYSAYMKYAKLWEMEHVKK